MQHETLKVEGMSCNHCVETITQSVKKLSGIKTVQVDLGNKEVSVEYDDARVQLEEIAATIQRAGFEVEGVE
ncbi:MAG: copper resistance protein CopZ [Nitrospinae bacterium CG11_big_fil_rev_8_21_14_0_20_56_8]|nr:MAG: copper resistance protein CopZ [Nitrospinae bacterium CG11_big_fil_rev_8_21_14_0_20_56_8]